MRQYTDMALVQNKKVRLDYTILDTFEAGIELRGFEVKSLKAGRGKLDGGRVLVRGGEAYLVSASIPAWQQANAPENYDSERPRRLLLHEKEIAQIMAAEGSAGLTIVPISVYNKGRSVKVEIAIVRGKKKYDKREDLKARDEKRRMQRTLKSR
jgi:SsrA-binding protein